MFEVGFVLMRFPHEDKKSSFRPPELVDGSDCAEPLKVPLLFGVETRLQINDVQLAIQDELSVRLEIHVAHDVPYRARNSTLACKLATDLLERGGFVLLDTCLGVMERRLTEALPKLAYPARKRHEVVLPHIVAVVQVRNDIGVLRFEDLVCR